MFLNIQERLINYTKLLSTQGGRTKNNDGTYSTTKGNMLNYVRLAELVETVMLKEKDADKILHVIKSMSPDLAIPTQYKTLLDRVMGTLKDR